MSLITIPQIDQTFAVFPDTPDRRDEETSFNTAAVASWERLAALKTELEGLVADINAVVSPMNTMTSGLSQQEPIEAYSTAESYRFPDCVAMPDGNTYRCIEPVSGWVYGSLPIQTTVVLDYGADPYISKTITSATAGKTYTFRVSALKASVGIKLYILTGAEYHESVGFEPTDFGVIEYSATIVATASSITCRIDLEPDPQTGAGVAVYKVWFSDNASPNINLLTGNGLWAYDLSSWTANNATMTVVPGVPTHWHNITASPIDDSALTSLVKTWSINKIRSLIDDTKGNGDTGYVWSADKIFDQLALKAPLSGADLTDAPTAPTAAAGTNTDEIATTAFVQTAVSPLRTGGLSISMAAPIANDEVYIKVPFGCTISRVDAGVKDATNAVIQLYEAANYAEAGTAILSSNLTATTSGANSTTFSNASIASGSFIRCVIISVSGTPGMVDINVTYTRT